MTGGVALCGASILLGGQLTEGYSVVIDHGTIVAVAPQTELSREIPRYKLDGGVLAPGFIDVQVNGGGGVLFNEAPDIDALRAIGSAHRRFGTTGFMPTVISDDPCVLDRAMRAVERAISELVPGVLGIHIEGPLLARNRKGIHDADYFISPNSELLDLYTSLKRGRTLVTLAPEVAEIATIARLAKANVLVSAGHTEATYEHMQDSFAAGLTGVTHLFNAMSPLGNREPGVVGAALENPDTWCGIIADGVHVHPATLRLAMKCHPVERFMLVTDAMPCVGSGAAHFTLSGREITVSGDRCTDEFGTLAGSNLTMAQAVRNAVKLLGLPVPVALAIASGSPATFLGLALERGSISPGMAADLAWLNEDLKVGATWIAGEPLLEGER